MLLLDGYGVRAASARTSGEKFSAKFDFFKGVYRGTEALPVFSVLRRSTVKRQDTLRPHHVCTLPTVQHSAFHTVRSYVVSSANTVAIGSITCCGTQYRRALRDLERFFRSIGKQKCACNVSRRAVDVEVGIPGARPNFSLNDEIIVPPKNFNRPIRPSPDFNWERSVSMNRVNLALPTQYSGGNLRFAPRWPD